MEIYSWDTEKWCGNSPGLVPTLFIRWSGCTLKYQLLYTAAYVSQNTTFRWMLRRWIGNWLTGTTTSGMPSRVQNGCLLKDWSVTEQYNINSTIQYLLHNKEKYIFKLYSWFLYKVILRFFHIIHWLNILFFCVNHIILCILKLNNDTGNRTGKLSTAKLANEYLQGEKQWHIHNYIHT
jgi:hypothetical protein